MISHCIIEDCNNLVENRDTGLCATHNKLSRKNDKPVKLKTEYLRKFSNERTRLEHQYKRKRKVWLKGKKCAGKFVHNCTPECELTIHHMQGRVGYADEWARENELPLLLDERFWLPLCLEAHQYINDNPKFAWENQYSFKRVTDPIFQKKDIHI